MQTAHPAYVSVVRSVSHTCRFSLLLLLNARKVVAEWSEVRRPFLDKVNLSGVFGDCSALRSISQTLPGLIGLRLKGLVYRHTWGTHESSTRPVMRML